MRAVARDVIRHPSWFGTWLIDHPARHWRFWRTLLLDKGQGWLRWGTDERTEYEYIDEGLEMPVPYMVAPPLRRFWFWVQQWLAIPKLMIVGVDLFDGLSNAPDDAHTRYRYSWEEARPETLRVVFTEWGVDKDRPRDLWETPKGWGRGRR
jgi:hypothetical protein